MAIQWQNLEPVINKRISRYIAVIGNSNGIIIKALFLTGNRNYADMDGLSPYTEYQIRVVGVSEHGKTFKSTYMRAWTEETGMYYL